MQLINITKLKVHIVNLIKNMYIISQQRRTYFLLWLIINPVEIEQTKIGFLARGFYELH